MSGALILYIYLCKLFKYKKLSPGLDHPIPAAYMGTKKYVPNCDVVMRFRQYSLILALFAWCALIGIVCAAASDCGCGGLPDSSPPSGWSDAGNSAMSSYSGFGGSGGGAKAGSSSSDQAGTGGNSQGSAVRMGPTPGRQIQVLQGAPYREVLQVVIPIRQ